MSKKNRKRLLSVLLTAALIFTLALSSVMAQDEEHVRADKLSVGTEAVEDEETVGGFLDEEEVAPDEETEETVSVDKINGAGSSVDDAAEEADADAAEVVEEEPESGIQTLSAEEPGDDEYGIQTLADTPVAMIGDVEYSSVANAISAAQVGDTITMYSDSSENLTVAAGQNITLDLNGHTLSSKNGKRVFELKGELTIKDSSDTAKNGTGTGMITGVNYSGSGGGVYVYKDAVLTLESGSICDNVFTSNSTVGGVGVYVVNATFYMTGGAIKNNSISGSSWTSTGYKGGGAGVSLSASEFYMSGGVISGNSSQKGAGVNLYNGSTFTMTGGEITDNNAKYGAGGGVRMSSDTDTFIMYDGLISGNSCYNDGGGISLGSATFIMYGGTITDNQAQSESGSSWRGGGVRVSSSGTVEIYGGTISGNRLKNGTEENVYLESGANIKLGQALSGTSQIGITTAKEPTKSGSTITNIQFTTAEDSTGYYEDSLDYFFSDYGYTVLLNNTNKYLEIGYDKYVAKIDETGVKYETVNDAINATTAAAPTVVLLQNVTEQVSAETKWDDTTPMVITLDLAGYTLTGAGSTVLTIDNETTLTLKDSVGGGMITGGKATDGAGVEINNSNGGGTFIMESGTISGNTATTSGNNRAGGGVAVHENGVFTMNGGTISDNTATDYGAGVWIDGGTFTMTGGNIENNNGGKGAGVAVTSGLFTLTNGEITGNTATNYSGGGVFVSKTGSFTMNGGMISGNTTTNWGGGVDVTGNEASDESKASFTMNGGTITGNTAGSGGSGVLAENGSSSMVFTVTGGTITGNAKSDGTTENVYLPSDAYITLGSNLSIMKLAGNSDTGKIGVTTATDPTAADESTQTQAVDVQFTTAETTGSGYYAESEDYFFGDKGYFSAKVEDGSDGYLVLTIPNDSDFEEAYLTDDPDATPTLTLYTEVTRENYEQILNGESSWNIMSLSDQTSVNSDLESTTYPELLEAAKVMAAQIEFEENYLTDPDNPDAGLYTAATADNYEQILEGADDWNALQAIVDSDTATQEEKDQAQAIMDAINADLTAANSGNALTYPELLAQAQELKDTAEAFIQNYASDNDVENPYTCNEMSDLDSMYRVLAGEDEWNAMSEEQKAVIDAMLVANGGDTYEELLEKASAALASTFEETYLMGDDGELYIEANADNYAQILSGLDDWNNLGSAAQAQVNADLTKAWQAEGNEGELTYPLLLEQAQALLDTANAFIASYVSDNDPDNPYESATMANFRTILDGEEPWNALSADEQAVVNELLMASVGKTYEDLLLEAEQDVEQLFENDYLRAEEDGDLYIEATKDNYLQILSGADDWELLNDAERELINADLTAAWQAAGGEGELTYPMLLLQAQAIADANEFEEKYLTGSDGTLYLEANADNYEQILSGLDDWNNMSDEAKAQVNADLTAAWQAAGHDGELTYEDLLAQAFQLAYLTDEDGNGPYTAATIDNYEQILAGADDWAKMSDEAKAAVNAALTAANGGVPLTYDDLLEQAKAFESANAFIYNFVSDNDVSNPYLEATVDNYQRILAGEDTWNAMSKAEQDAVNAILTAAWQAAGHDGELTYPMLLEWAKALAAQLEAGGGVKTGDNARLYLYLLLIAAAGAAASAAVAVSRRRV